MLDDDAAVFFFPIPHFLKKSFTPEVTSGLALILAQLLLHLGLGGDSSVIRSRKPEHIFALHAGAAGQDVLDRVVENMPEVQDAGHVGRRNDDGIGLL